MKGLYYEIRACFYYRDRQEDLPTTLIIMKEIRRGLEGSLNWAAGQALVTCAVSTQGEPCNLTPPRPTPTLPKPPVAFTGH